MSKKHYVRIARDFAALLNDREWKYKTAKHVFDDMVDAVASMFADNNESFDRKVFKDVVYHTNCPCHAKEVQ